MAASSNRGGKRPGAGRPKGTGPFRETTQAIRVPCGLLPRVKSLINLYKDNPAIMLGRETIPSNVIPLFSNKVAAGQPTPTEDSLEGAIDLTQHLVQNPRSTFLVRVQGDSMIDAGIFPNDLLVVDSSLKPEHGKVVIAAVDGELTVKRLELNQDKVSLLPENTKYKPIAIKEEMSFSITGVVTNVIHALS